MEGIVIQLQKDALDDSIDIETLLRKTFLVARKLNLEDFKKWILEEQNGYKSKVPDYRMIHGEIYGWNPYHGWVPVIMDGEFKDILSTMPIGTSIASISDAYKNSDGNISLTLNGIVTQFLNKSCNGQTKYCMQTSKSELNRILCAVRNKILDWAILLEENGIVGVGLSFNNEEKERASINKCIYNYTNNFYSKVDQVQIEQADKIK